MQVLNENAKNPYYYNRYTVDELTDELLKSMLYERAYIQSNRHKAIKMHGNKNGKGISYYDICCGFDCETYTDPVIERGYMYIWQFSINQNVIIGRTYDELPYVLDWIKRILQPKQNNRLLVLDHNMGYEFSWFKGWLNLNDADQNFLKDKRTPLKLTHDSFVEFRDSCMMTGGSSLAQLAKDYTNTQKCVNDLSYDTPRNRYTILSEIELGYCCNDVLILSEYADFVFREIVDYWHKLPMTRTGLLKLKAKKHINDNYNNNENIIHESIIKRSAPTEDIYKLWINYLYRGGYNHANVEIVAEEIWADLLGVDITSSYPFCMTQKIFAEQLSDIIPSVTKERVNEDIANGLVSIFIARFKGIHSTGLHSIESKSKCMKLDPTAVIDNGRVFSCKGEMIVYLTSFDWINYQRYYSWESVEITQYQYSKTRYLYKHVVCPMLDSYLIKHRLKHAGEPYSIPKGEVNSWYGVNVQKLTEDVTKYSNAGFSTDTKKSYEEQIANNVVCALDGIFISAFARFRLLDMCWNVHELGSTGIYADTDSWKFYNPTPEVLEYINKLNEQITEENKKNIEYFTEYDEAYADLGTWDIEFYPWSMYDSSTKNTYIRRFKSLGCKRYIIEVDAYNKNTKTRERQLVQTVAGLPKGAMIKQYETIDTCFNAFDDDMVIEDCKLLSKYVDEPYEITVTDEQGHTDTHTEYSCCALLPNKFSLSIDDLWKLFYINYAVDRLNASVEYRLL